MRAGLWNLKKASHLPELARNYQGDKFENSGPKQNQAIRIQREDFFSLLVSSIPGNSCGQRFLLTENYLQVLFLALSQSCVLHLRLSEVSLWIHVTSSCRDLSLKQLPATKPAPMAFPSIGWLRRAMATLDRRSRSVSRWRYKRVCKVLYFRNTFYQNLNTYEKTETSVHSFSSAIW